MDEHTFEINRERAIDYLNTRDNVYVFDGFAGVSSIPLLERTVLNDYPSGNQLIGSKSELSALGHITLSSCTTC
jgi:ATP-dependent phosphoenolpyruvate carboxykinase